jgi:hypothetical protein
MCVVSPQRDVVPESRPSDDAALASDDPTPGGATSGRSSGIGEGVGAGRGGVARATAGVHAQTRLRPSRAT